MFRLKKSLVIAMITVGMASAILWGGLFFYLLSHSPSTPLPATGQIYPLHDHGYVFYVSKTQSICQDILPAVFLVFFFGAVILNMSWKVIPNTDTYNKLKKFY